jgi:xanthine dehydrogenase accessory factor
VLSLDEQGQSGLTLPRTVHHPVFESLAKAAERGEPVTLGLISGVKGSSPQKTGAKALFYADGRIAGTMGGGCLEAEIQLRAIQSLRTNQPSEFKLLLDHDFGWDDGLICGGNVQGLIIPNAQQAGKEFWRKLAERRTAIHWGVASDFSIGLRDTVNKRDFLYEETVSPPCELWIAGAGHIAQAVAPLAEQLDFAVSVFDDRPALASPLVFPAPIEIKCDSWDNLFLQPLPDRPSFGLIVTRGHRHDSLVLREWLRKPFLFIGMIGSERKARIIFDHFLAEKIATEIELQRVACPVGIKMRSTSVPEIAVSIMAQFIDKRAELTATPSAERGYAPPRS